MQKTPRAILEGRCHKTALSIIATILIAITGCAEVLEEVIPRVETSPVLDASDAADDSVVIATSDGENAIIIGTNKRRGLEIYDLKGNRIGQIDAGRLNNVDATPTATDNVFLVAASNRTTKAIDIFRADIIKTEISFVRSIPLNLADPYGLCVSSNRIFVSDKDGLIQMWPWVGEQPITEIVLPSQTEGCVVDENDEYIYIGEEGGGIWKVPIHGEDMGTPEMFTAIADNILVADVEGLDIHYSEKGATLLASSQGDNSYVAYDLQTAKVLAKFSIAANAKKSIDGTSDTDGIAIYSQALLDYPEGILVVQDGFNSEPNGKYENQNFKVIDWRDVQKLLKN